MISSDHSTLLQGSRLLLPNPENPWWQNLFLQIPREGIHLFHNPSQTPSQILKTPFRSHQSEALQQCLLCQIQWNKVMVSELELINDDF